MRQDAARATSGGQPGRRLRGRHRICRAGTLSAPELVAEAAARALKVRWGAGLSPSEALLDFLAPRETLLLLDNCEYLIEGCAQLADVLLRSCPGLKILATSREALRVPGERAWLVPSLSLPDVGEDVDLEQIGRHESVRLFVERAEAASPDFTLSEQNAPAVARICSGSTAYRSP